MLLLDQPVLTNSELVLQRHADGQQTVSSQTLLGSSELKAVPQPRVRESLLS